MSDDPKRPRISLTTEAEQQRKTILEGLGLTEEQMKLATLAGQEFQTGPGAYLTLSAAQRVALAKEVMRQDALEAVAKAAKLFRHHACACAVINQGRGPKCSACTLRDALAVLELLEGKAS